MKPLKKRPVQLPKLDTAPLPGEDRRMDPKGTLDKKIWRYTRDDWHKIVRAYEANPGSFYNAWHYLNEHPIYWRLSRYKDSDLPLRHARRLETGNAFDQGSIWVHVARVNPKTRRVEDDPFLNTKTEIWLETGEWSWDDPESHYHNYKIDCGGPTYEAAVIRMARRVHDYYGNDRRQCEPDRSRRYKKKHDKRKNRIGKIAVIKNPYGHSCRHRYPSGAMGDIERQLAELGL